MHPQAKHPTIGIERKFRMADMIAPMRVGQEGFVTLCCPFHRPANLGRSPDADRLLGIDENF